MGGRLRRLNATKGKKTKRGEGYDRLIFPGGVHLFFRGGEGGEKNRQKKGVRSLNYLNLILEQLERKSRTTYIRVK